MTDHQTLDEQSPAVRTHLELMQGVIERMASNSRSCKVWCVTLAAAVLVLVARTGEARHALIALVPSALFLVLDMYYLALERAFIVSYNRLRREAAQARLAPAGPLYHFAIGLSATALRTLPVVILDMAVLRSDGYHDTAGVVGDPLVGSDGWRAGPRDIGCLSVFMSETSSIRSSLSA